MSESKIEWTGFTWEPTAGCTHVSEGCRHCYAEKLVAGRLCGVARKRKREGKANGSAVDLSLDVINHKTGKWNGHVEPLGMNLEQPLKRRKPTVYFVNSRSDLFHPDVPFEYIDRVFAVMALCPQHRFQVLTKRPERMQEYLTRREPLSGSFTRKRGCEWKTPSDRVYGIVHCKKRSQEVIERGMVWPLPNVWLGTSAENQEQANKRISDLLQCPAAMWFVSAEPLLGEVDLNRLYSELPCPGGVFERRWRSSLSGKRSDLSGFSNTDIPKLDWVIVGGESGPGARGCNVAWIRSIVEQCKSAGVPVFVKQLGAHCVHPDCDYRSLDFGGGVQFAGTGTSTDMRVLLNNSKGGDPAEWPEDLRVREIPDGLQIGGG